MPLGLESFEEIRRQGYYYIDKTEMIARLLQKSFKVNLFTRPRRFGKSLAIKMLEIFFDIRKDSEDIFQGLNIEKQEALCREWRNQWPVVSVTLKEVEDRNFASAREKLKINCADLYKEHSYLLDSDKVDAADRQFFERIRYQEAKDEELYNAWYVLMRMMHACFGRKVILLIDEYDVPLAMANEGGYYDEMLGLVRGLMGKALKSNPFLKFAVVTGCLRIAKENIFSGTNPFVSDTVNGERFNEFFGFTHNEVKRLLQDTGFETHEEEIRRWYNGYRFGSVDIYCPWDVLNYVNALQDDPDKKPESYWENTSHNGILRNFIERANTAEQRDAEVNDKFEILLSGGCIREHIEQNLTYDTVHSSEENLWSLLYLTGYLTQAKQESPSDEEDSEKLSLRIPNEEVKVLFRKTVAEWFRERISKIDRSELFQALWNGDDEKATEIISDLLFDTISYYDYKEDFYHAFLAGIFAGAGFYVESNREHGTGRTDLVVRDRSRRRVMIIKTKRADSEKMLEKECEKAAEQITKNRYAGEFSRGYRSVICYGAAFFNKMCLVKNITNTGYNQRKKKEQGK